MLLCILCALAGMGLWCFHQGIILVQLPHQTKPLQASTTTSTLKKSVTLYFGPHERDMHEVTDVVVTPGDERSELNGLMCAWLRIAQQEQIISKKISLRSALLDQRSHTAYLSFNKPLFTKTMLIAQKWQLLEGILKTVRTALPRIERVMFLVRHAPQLDQHLDCTQPWPIRGFIGASDAGPQDAHNSV